MRQLIAYLDEYSESHKNEQNIIIHNICVPAIMWSLLGMAHTFRFFYDVRLSHLIIIGALFYYLRFRNLRVFVVMAVASILIVHSFEYVPSLFVVSSFVFVVAWIGQFYGHKIEGKKPSFVKDLQFLLIGPIWVLQKMVPRFLKLK